MRLLGRRRHPLSEIRGRDDATLARSGASTTELLRLVNVGPFLKAFGTEYLPVKHTSGLIFCNSGQIEMVSISNFTRKFANGQEYAVNFPYTDDFDFPYVSFGINLDAPPDRPSIQKALVKCLPGVRSGGRFA
jgi:hypothetical protein